MSEPEAEDDGGVHEAESKVTTTAASVTASCIAICEVSADCNYLWLSPSFKAILGYEPAEMIGYSPFDLIHPDEREALQEVRQSMVYDKIATLIYSRWKHKKGHYLLCAVGASIVCDKILGSFCIAVPEPKAKLRAATAQEVLEISPEAQDQFRKQKWYNSSPPRRTSDSFLVRADRERLRIPLKDLKPPSVRSFFLIDRFSQTENIFYISNNMLVKKPDVMIGKSFYDLVREEDRDMVRSEIKMAKSWAASTMTGVEQSSFAYITFQLIQPDELPIEVQGVLTAYSDGVTCIIRIK